MEIVLIAVQSLDGFITRHHDPGVGFASVADHHWFREAMDRCDAVVMGSNTYAVARPVIQKNLHRELIRYVLTSNPGKWSADAVPGKLMFSNEPPVQFCDRLIKDGIRRLGVLGGSQVNTAFLAAGLVDELWLTLEPKLFGHGLQLTSGTLNLEWELVEQRRLAPSVLMLRYKRIEPTL